MDMMTLILALVSAGLGWYLKHRSISPELLELETKLAAKRKALAAKALVAELAEDHKA